MYVLPCFCPIVKKLALFDVLVIVFLLDSNEIKMNANEDFA